MSGLTSPDFRALIEGGQRAGLRCTIRRALLRGRNTGAMMQHVSQGFDFRRFHEALDAVREQRVLTWRQVARETGLSPSSLTRFSHGSRPDVETVATLCAWAGLNLGEFAGRPQASDHLTMATAYLKSDPALTEDAAAALEQLLRVTYSRLRSVGPGEESHDG